MSVSGILSSHLKVTMCSPRAIVKFLSSCFEILRCYCFVVVFFFLCSLSFFCGVFYFLFKRKKKTHVKWSLVLWANSTSKTAARLQLGVREGSHLGVREGLSARKQSEQRSECKGSVPGEVREHAGCFLQHSRFSSGNSLSLHQEPSREQAAHSMAAPPARDLCTWEKVAFCSAVALHPTSNLPSCSSLHTGS